MICGGSHCRGKSGQRQPKIGGLWVPELVRYWIDGFLGMSDSKNNLIRLD
jgi:hypothetical protein